MKKYLFILLFLGAFIQKSFAQTFNWVDSATGFNLMAGYYQPGCKVSVDDSDNVYVTGYLYSSFSLRKYNSSGALEWTNSTSDYHAVATDSWGNCYVTGSFGGGSFFEKYNTNGTGIRNYLAGGPDGPSVIGNAISYDGGKYFYITGSWGNGTVVLGSQTISVSNNDGAPDLFILKCDTAGNVIWARTSISGKSPGECCGLGIKATPNGLIYVTGYFADSVLLGGDSLNTSLSYPMAFVACYDTVGNVKWAHSTGRYNSSCNAVSSDGAGNIYVTGEDGFTEACFIAKYRSNGDSVWWKQTISCCDGSYGFGIATNSSGTSYVTGSYSGDSFGSLTLQYGHSENEIYIVEYDSSGNATWGYDPNDTLPNSVGNAGCGVAVDKGGCNFYFTGITEVPALFANTYIDLKQSTEFYVTKLNNGCIATDEQNQQEPKKDIKVYPNPFTSSSTVLFNETGKHQLELEDMTGRILQQFECSGQQYELQRGNLASGMYFIKVTDAQNNVSVSKILVQ